MGALQQAKLFARSTPMHGVKFMFNDDAHCMEKLLWITLFISSVTVAAYYAHGLLNLFQYNPFIVSVYRANAPVALHDFPALTICNAEQYSEKKFHDMITDLGYTKHQPVFRSMLQYMLSGLGNGKNGSTREFYPLLATYNLTEENIVWMLLESSQSCENLLQFCSWQEKALNCSHFTEQILTDAGVCCTVNNQLTLRRRSYARPISQKHSRSQQDIPDSDATKPPTLSLGPAKSGIRQGLTLILKAPIVSKQLFNRPFVGFRVLVHNNFSIPRMTQKSFPVAAGRVNNIGVRVTGVFTTKNPLLYPPLDRGCYMTGEKELQGSKVYTVNNCLIDCQIGIAMKTCSCIPYYLSEITSHRICYPHEYPCLLDTSDFSQNFWSPSCPGCLSACNQTYYRADIVSDAPLNKSVEDMALFQASSIKSPIQSDDYSILHVYYDLHSSIIYKRDVKYGWEELLAAMGGLLSVGFGMSLINALEFVYFAIFRWVSG